MRKESQQAATWVGLLQVAGVVLGLGMAAGAADAVMAMERRARMDWNCILIVVGSFWSLEKALIGGFVLGDWTLLVELLADEEVRRRGMGLLIDFWHCRPAVQTVIEM